MKRWRRKFNPTPHLRAAQKALAKELTDSRVMAKRRIQSGRADFGRAAFSGGIEQSVGRGNRDWLPRFDSRRKCPSTKRSLVDVLIMPRIWRNRSGSARELIQTGSISVNGQENRRFERRPVRAIKRSKASYTMLRKGKKKCAIVTHR
ncbi:MAG: hypothetical protein MZU97_17515 [Bacillus subtilis]|nr:hypothetical protein [Bacillus subtilis]